MRDENYLFADRDLSEISGAQERQMLAEIDAIPQKELLALNVDELCDYLHSKYELTAPTLDDSAITVQQSEAKIDVSQDPRRLIHDRSRPIYITGTTITYYVSFNGDAAIFTCTPSTRTYDPPKGTVHGSELLITYQRTPDETGSVKTQFDRDLGEIRRYLGWAEGDLRTFNDSLRSKARGRIDARRQKALQDAELVTGLGYPLRRREDAPTTYVVPAVRKKPTYPRPKPGKRAEPPEPTLEMGTYEEILSIIENMVLVIERSPHAFRDMGEEDFRQHFLVQLNAQYEGLATGETFNYEGKTDILVRIEGRNAFIAECKFWKGPKSLSETIDQLIKYTSWRDTKTAVILFNRTKNFSSVLAQIPEIVRAHPSYVRDVPTSGETRFRYVLHHRDDPERELILTVLAFDVPN